eukprot:CAMPEP_0181223488 /NCGR_PEP_ID=MMETSP1096-20121128/30567_1 /TAXON_ID=156174 ORGANISM="Chrysochromulina ericina, Strain CCMP281" /NCGR_SAMPLE_ID=MMETSP1096 /ASSEMBLY_ACC=CAM_ASM_000453 /LENGTH=142 /DNA_ID=CAMNT_0023316401 /DNA_START=94 /DNA_END=517 /DNA_ORIENTATION=-
MKHAMQCDALDLKSRIWDLQPAGILCSDAFTLEVPDPGAPDPRSQIPAADPDQPNCRTLIRKECTLFHCLSAPFGCFVATDGFAAATDALERALPRTAHRVATPPSHPDVNSALKALIEVRARRGKIRTQHRGIRGTRSNGR